MFLKEFKKKGVNNGNNLDCRIETSIEVWATRAIMGAMEIMNFEFWIGHKLQACASGGNNPIIYCIFAQSSWILVFFFFKHKITNFRELLLYYRNKFKQLLKEKPVLESSISNKKNTYKDK